MPRANNNEIDYSNISITGIKSESTPIQRKSVDFSDYITSETKRTSNNTSTLKQNNLDPLESDDTTTAEELEELVTLHPELNLAKKDGDEINPVNLAHIMFSPKKNKQPPKPQELPQQSKSIQKSSSEILNPWTPYILTLYFQLVVNVILWSILIYFIFISITTIKSDINKKVESNTLEILDEISKCSKLYLLNKCNSKNRPWAIEKECEALEKCQNQDPTSVARSKVTMEVIVEILNTFAERLHYKTFFIFISFLICCILLTSLNLRNFQKLGPMENNSRLKIKEN
ncbi:unnamed protein product [Candida verbasci]|uniref:Brl1/Brr6 domain-containing protein n=1 Tax=Candida verbasci TaxID=1227364 RepID=A0A9W4TXJ3_9ASCO|nr:unnamed protein product [Candida verbasci]